MSYNYKTRLTAQIYSVHIDLYAIAHSGVAFSACVGDSRPSTTTQPHHDKELGPIIPPNVA
jgi:hypothetical protein